MQFIRLDRSRTVMRLFILTFVLLALPELARASTLRAFVVDVSEIKPPSKRPVAKLTGAIAAMKDAGFEAAPLPLDRSPLALGADVIVLGSFSDGDAGVKAYLQSRGPDLIRFVSEGGILLQMAQLVDEELLQPARRDELPSEPFLPKELRAIRGIADTVGILADVRVVAKDHPLLDGLVSEGEIKLPTHFRRAPAWEVFAQQSGFAVLLTAGPNGTRDPVMLEAAHGRGRYLLTSMYFDKLADPAGDSTLAAPEPYVRFADRFFHNLDRYAHAVKADAATAVAVTPPYETPAPLPFVNGSWTLAILPDTQVYAQRHPELFEAQTRWIAQNVKARNIKYVLHLGDITNRNTRSQWEIAQRTIAHLDGVVPYALVPGNHDLGLNGKAETRDTFLHEYFPPEKFQGWPTFGGVMEPGRLDNNYHVFKAGGHDWIVIGLEFGPRDGAVDWANRVLAEHPNHLGILVTHVYLDNDDTRHDRVADGRPRAESPHAAVYKLNQLPGGVNDGGELWRKLASRHPRMVFVLNGHVLGDGVARLTSPGVHGNAVHQILSNYQVVRPHGGNGFLRLLEFLPDGETVQARTYSPALNAYKTDPQNQFTLKLKLPK